jgi:hypothetical protein
MCKTEKNQRVISGFLIREGEKFIINHEEPAICKGILAFGTGDGKTWFSFFREELFERLTLY